MLLGSCSFPGDVEDNLLARSTEVNGRDANCVPGADRKLQQSYLRDCQAHFNGQDEGGDQKDRGTCLKTVPEKD